MIQRLATEYVKTCLKMSETELKQWMAMLAEHNVRHKVKVLDNGNQELVLQPESGEELSLIFDCENDRYVFNGSCLIKDKTLTNIMRKAVSEFKGDAVVNRRYPKYTMVYCYKNGSVVRITEQGEHHERLVYEYKDTVGEMHALYNKQLAETEIERLRDRIDGLLDERIEQASVQVNGRIDQELAELNHRLYILEA